MQKTRTPKFPRSLLASIAVLTVVAACGVESAAATGATQVFDFLNFNGAASAISTSSNASFNGPLLTVTTGGSQHEAGGAWYRAQQNITSFTTQFTFQMPRTGIVPSIIGMTFCVQNGPPGNFSGIYASSDANVDGYGAYIPFGQTGIQKSIAVKFDIGSNSGNEVTYPTGGSPSATGLYINGGPSAALFPQNDLNPFGINLNAGHIMAATIVYDGALLTLTLRDTVTNAQVRTSWPIDIPSVVGGNNAWVGFTAGEIPGAVNAVLSWSFSEGYAPRLATPSFAVAAGSYTSAQSVSINAAAGSTIYYTTNGQQPTTSSSKYSGPISVSSNQILQAVAIEPGFTDSLVGVANYQIAAAGTPLINFPNGFSAASGLVTSVGSAKVNGSTIRLTDTNPVGMEVGAAWYAVPVNVATFNTHFTVQFTSAQGQGMTFCIQNQNPASSDKSSLTVSGGPYAMANDQDGLGYSGSTGTGGQISGFNTSVAVIFDVHNGSGNLTGLYTNGTNPTGSSIDMSSSGVNIKNGNPLNVTLAYDGTTLALTVTDAVTKKSFAHNWTIDIPATVAGKAAYVGFTGSTGYWFANQDIHSWTYSTTSNSEQTVPSPAVPAAPTNLRVQ